MRKSKPVFYGWWVVVGLFFSTFLGAWGRFVLSTFAPAMTKDTGWTTSQIMLSVTITLFTYALGNIFAGRTNRSEIIGLFLALLELVRSKRVLITQEKNFGTISVEPNPDPPEEQQTQEA